MSNSPINAQRFLESLQRHDLALLVSKCEVWQAEIEIGDEWFGRQLVEQVYVAAPPPIDEALRQMPGPDRKRIAEAITSAFPSKSAPDDISVSAIDTPAKPGAASLLAELIIHREMMIDVATGGRRIQEVDDYYRARDARIRQSIPNGVAYENPHADLWSWYQFWSANLPQYRDRRSYIRQVFAPAIDGVAKRPSLPSEPREVTGWERVDRALSKARTQLERATAEEDFQAIGLICREVIISLAQAVYDPVIHESLDGVTPSETDANRMLEAYIASAFPGPSYKEVRAHARASLGLTLNLQHRRTANQQLAALCVEATASTTAVVSIIARAQD